jgi:hypothetical protein
MRSMLKSIVCVLILCAVSATLAFAEGVPQLVNVQGLLTDSGDEPVADGAHEVTFAVYNVENGGSELWSETRTVSTEDGLFTIILGETNPLTESLFAYPDLWLGITVSGDTEMTPRQRLTSVPYALNAPGAGGSGSGWVVDGNNLYAEDENYNIGIGTDSPNWKLDVAGDINASDSLIGNKLRIGSASVEGKLALYGPLTNGPFFELNERWNGGCDFFLRDANGNVAVGFQSINAYGAGGYGWLNRNDGSQGIALMGSLGSDNEPKLNITGTSRSVEFDMAESGDDAVQLPSSSISNSEIKNEPGVSNSVQTSSEVLGNSPEQLDNIYINCPSDGYVLVFAVFNMVTWHGGDEFAYFKITSEASASFPSTYSYSKTYVSTLPCCQYIEPIMLFRYFSVDAGGQYFYLYGQEGSGHSSVDDIILSAVFIPSWYGPLFPGVSEAEDGTESFESAPSEMERIIDERVKLETKAIESRFEQRLAALKEELPQANGK